MSSTVPLTPDEMLQAPREIRATLDLLGLMALKVSFFHLLMRS